jgi:hypothetical protein
MTGRPPHYPRHLLKAYGGSSRQFEITHRKRLRAALKALREACYGCAYAPSMNALVQAEALLKEAIQATQPANWVRGRG